MGLKATKDYKVKIDKTAPEATFAGTDNYGTTGYIGVTLTDELSGVKEAQKSQVRVILRELQKVDLEEQ